MKKIFALIVGAACCIGAQAAECSIPIAVLPSPQTENVPEATIQYLNNRLTQIASQNDIVADAGITPYIITAKFSHIFEETLPGPPIQTALHTYLTLYVGDVNSQTVYYSTTIELRGVGTSPERAFISALRAVNAKNREILAFVDKARDKVLDYYNKNYRNIMAKADNAAAQHDYERALWILSSVPECCTGYQNVAQLTRKYFQKYIDQEGQALYAQANAVWSASQNAKGASSAFGYLTMIDPQSAAYPRAESLAAEIKAVVKDDKTFEMRQKYNDDIDLQKRQIEAARAVGIAYGNGQKPVSTNLNWIR